MEHSSELVADGKLTHETSYPQRAEKYTELQLGGIKIDFFDAQKKVVHEVKRSAAMEETHEWQLKYYLYVLGEFGISGASGVLEYPRLRQTKAVTLTPDDESEITEALVQIEHLVSSQDCPARVKRKLCDKCSYFDFCYAGEDET